MNNILIILLLILLPFVHEFLHYILAMYYGYNISFSIEYVKLFNYIIVPRGIWFMPEDLNLKQKTIVGLAGFIGEFIYALICCLFGFKIVLIFMLLHLFLYKYYCGEKDDFQYLKQYVNRY